MRIATLAAVALASCTAAPAAVPVAANPPSIRVIDGDTLVIDGETIRIANIDAPETMPRSRCWAEARLSKEATFALEVEAASWAALPPTITRDGTDRYGRTLATIQRTDGQDVGAMLIESGLAVPWTGRRWEWCGPVTDVAAGADLLRAKPSPLSMLTEAP